jgi:hypothetical protein
MPDIRAFFGAKGSQPPKPVAKKEEVRFHYLFELQPICIPWKRSSHVVVPNNYHSAILHDGILTSRRSQRKPKVDLQRGR